MAKTRTGFPFDDDLTHIVKVFLKDNREIVSALGLAKVQNRNGLSSLVADSGKWSTIKWKNPQTQQEELLSDDKKLWVEKIISFINHLQNDYGGKIMYPVDLSNLDYNHFQRYCTLTTAEGGHPTPYNHAAALQSEIRNHLGSHALAPPPSTPANTSGNPSSTGGNNSSNSRGNSTQLTAIQQQIALFVKSLPADLAFPTLGPTTNYIEWQLTAEGYLELKDIPILSPGYSVPSDVTSDEYKLYSKQNTFLYLKLQQNCKTNASMRAVKAHRSDKNGRAVYLQIEKDNTGGSLTAELRAKYFHHLIHTMVAQKRSGEYVNELNRFHSTVAEYNTVCQPGEELEGVPLLTQMERFIAPLPELKLLEKNASTMDRQLSRRGVSNSSLTKDQQAKYRMDDYDDAALRLDDEYKALAIGSIKASNRLVNVSEVALYDATLGQLTTAAQEQLSDERAEYDVNVVQSLIDSQEASANFDEATVYYQVNAVEGEGRRYGYLPKEIYDKMSPAAQRQWMSLPANVREMIIIYQGVPKTAPKQGASPAGPASSAGSAQSSRPGRGILRGTGVATGARAANQTELVPVSEGDSLRQGNTVTISETISEAIENETYGPTAFLDNIRNQRSVHSATSSPADYQAMRDLALGLPAGDLRRGLSQFALDNTPVTRITDDDSVPALRENNSAHIKFVHEQDSLTVPSTVTDSYNTYGDDPDELHFFDALD